MRRGFAGEVVLALMALCPPAFAGENAAAPTQNESTAPDASGDSTWYGTAWRHVDDAWRRGGYELYVPFYTYHMPYAYSPALLRSYNDFPAGGGIGKGRYNESGNWEGLYAIEFADSHGRPEYIGGYGWIATWRPFANDFRTGAGFTGFITARSDIRRYTPFPATLPLASIGYWDLDLQATFVPGGKDDGNVLFCWVKLSLP